ncbi:3-ketoacyl-CoA thiolase [Rubrobacter xylanophilus DSM 9941]|uniref:acetyl-CoA C-acyltransferase n=1 Tax=Rubrobacter xylanophilus (strain DSM 9941 / JCM 11954 / NBRC 16129 / PRD-1) TaxID=266117 RepID=Q1AT97_RUBXD|nr:thiolase family protein [Rubrobacter xylanophilus]ABG05381.1 3-ketoacyl-CoA thiolase [Rubrobacter xylanophilus DSM 9941]
MTDARREEGRRVVLVDGVRTPFMRAGTAYLSQTSYDLARTVLRGLLERAGVAPESVGYVVMGTVIQNISTSNVARDAALAAGLPSSVPAHTVTMACISANQAITSALETIRAGKAEAAVAGGVEVMSDTPPQFGKKARERLFLAQGYRSPLEFRRLLSGMSPSDFLPRAPAISEYSTGELMGESADRLAAAFGVSREEQDEYALRTHTLAAKATESGRLAAEILPTAPPPDFELLTEDNTIRRDTSLEKLAALPPAFVKPLGTVTAGNSSPLTDGAAATLLMEEDAARAAGHEPKARLADYLYVAQDPGEELLLGPAYAVPRLLERNGLSLSDIDVLEIHEAFAGQVLAVLRALESDRFARERLGLGRRVGEVEMERVNAWGGSVSLGHPFGATGARLVTTAANRLREEDGRFAVVTACAAGGLGHAMLVERIGEG